MRSKSALVQTLTAFGSEGAMAYNMLTDAFFEWSLDARQEGKSYKSTVGKHGKKFAKTVSNFVVKSSVVALLGALIDAVRDDDDEEFDEKYVEAFKDRFFSSVNPINTLPILRDLESMWNGFSPSRLDEQSLKTFIDACKTWGRVFEGKSSVYKASYKSLQALSQMTGLPMSNAIRDVVAMWNTTVGEAYPSLKIK